MPESKEEIKDWVRLLVNNIDKRIEKLEKLMMTPEGQNCISILSARQNNIIIELSELKERLLTKDWGIQIIDRIINYEEVLRELLEKMWSWYAIGKPTSYDRQCYSKSLKNTLNKLGGDKSDVISENPGMGFVVCPKCKEKWYLYRSDLE